MDATYRYYYTGDQLARMTVGSNELKFGYSANGTPVSLLYNDTYYFYALNAQGDVTALLSVSGTPVVEYTYDAWGRVLSITGSKASTVGRYNPLRYRGYVYDNETELYYLQSRYYDPAWGRFINADGYVATGQGFVGNNMFAYCNNNPVNRQDEQGTLFNVIAGGVIGAIFGGVSAAINGENVLFGALIGGMTGMAIATVGIFVTANTFAAGVIKAATGAVFNAASNAFNQYTNYRLQDKAKRENEKNGVTTSSSSTLNGQSQAIADEAYNAKTFGAYVDKKSVAISALTGAGAEALSFGYGLKAPKPNLVGLPKSVWPEKLARGAMISFEISMLQVGFDIGLS